MNRKTKQTLNDLFKQVYGKRLRELLDGFGRYYYVRNGNKVYLDNITLESDVEISYDEYEVLKNVE